MAEASDYLKLQISGDHHHHHRRGQVLQTSVRGLSIPYSAGGQYKQLVPVGITDWLNFTLSGSNGPGWKPYRLRAYAVSGWRFCQCDVSRVDYSVMEIHSERVLILTLLIAVCLRRQGDLSRRQTDKTPPACTINNGETLEVSFGGVIIDNIDGVNYLTPDPVDRLRQQLSR